MRLKSFIYYMVAVILCISNMYQTMYAYSSFISQRSVGSYETTGIFAELFEKNEKIFYTTPFLQGNFNASSLAQQFTVNGESSFILDQKGLGDINPLWLGLGNDSGDYNSVVEFSPIVMRGGAGIHYRANFDTFFVQVDSAVVGAYSNMQVREFDSPNNGIQTTVYALQTSTIKNAHDAFANPDFVFGKIGIPQNRFGVENLQCKIGGYYQAQMNRLLIVTTPYVMFSLPTGQKPDAQYMFAPQVGSNHFGIGTGVSTMFEKLEDIVLIDVAVNYTGKSNEVRSFDLVGNGKWSRYLQLQKIAPNLSFGGGFADGVSIPGINVLTQNALVAPGFSCAATIRYGKQWNRFGIFAGYAFFGRRPEKITGISNIGLGYAIVALGASNPGISPATTASTARIDQSAISSGNYNQVVKDPAGSVASTTTLTTSDLDLNSAVSSAFVTNTATVGWRYNNDRLLVQGSVALEFPYHNQGITTWSLWALFAYQF